MKGIKDRRWGQSHHGQSQTLGTPICPAMMPQEGWCPCDGSVPTLGLFPSPNHRFVPRGNPHGTNPGTGETKQRLCRGMRKPEQPHAWVPRIPQPSRCPRAHRDHRDMGAVSPPRVSPGPHGAGACGREGVMDVAFDGSILPAEGPSPTP